MAVLKSFELDGNKKSFANWISNLSPTSTPFTSMIGKEKIDQTQYSWQTDTLAPATAETFEEGSQATFQPRATTKIFTNFTSLVRRAARVSDTNECTHAYGRRDEMAYQMGMAGKAVLRDIEYMNLSTRRARVGSATEASVYSGFKDLCAPLFMPDPDTFAMTHQGVAILDETKPWFALKDIFKVTSDLFLAGSRADKIMFHPKHINIFSDHIGYNEEEPMMFRLFDNLDTKYNATVSKIKDPVGRVYTLIPNRWMPEGEVYIFSEKDWTQMVLQQPVRKQLAKKGSSNSIYVETEVGLRHKHPHASGVLDLIVVNYISHLSLSKEKMTAFIGDTAQLEFTALEKNNQPANNVSAYISPSLELGLAFDKTRFLTDTTGIDTIEVSADRPTKAVLFAFSDEAGKVVMTNPVEVEVVPPTVEFSVTGKVQTFKDTHIDFKVTDAQGNPVPNGTILYISVDEGLELARPTSDHIVVQDGRAAFGISPSVVGKLHFRAAFSKEPDAWKTFPYEIDVVDNDFRIEFAPDTKGVLTQHIDGTQSVAITLYEGTTALGSELVKFKSLNGEVVDFLSDEYQTNSAGVATTQMGIYGIGETQIVATYKNKSASFHIRVGGGSLQLSLSKPKLEVGDFDGSLVSAQVLDADGKPAAKSGLHISWNKHPESMHFEFEDDSSITDDQGVASTHIQSGDVVEKGKVAAYWREAEEQAEIDFEVIRNQYQIAFNDDNYLYVTGNMGDAIGLSVKVDVNGKTFLAPAGHELTFTSNNTNIVNWDKRNGTTDATGYVEPSNTFHADGFGEAIVTVSGTSTDQDEFLPATKRVVSRKPKVSMTSTIREMLVGDTSEITVVLQDPEGNTIGFTGDLPILVNKNVFSTSGVASFGNGRAVVSLEAIQVGESELNVTLQDGTNLTVVGTNKFTVVNPSLRITSTPEAYRPNEAVEIEVFLVRPAASTADLKDREITLTISPDTLTGLSSGTKVVTDEKGKATFTSGNIVGNSDYEITASYNGVTSEVYDLACAN